MDIKYQVFVSSTYSDLIEERQEVMQALLELDCFPVGMELFPAADDDQWTLIKGLIKDCDYYVLIIGGRYGSIGPDGKSYTQMEYEFAVSEGIPVISFVNADPGKIPSDKTELSDSGKVKLKGFIDLAKTKMCKLWKTPSDLGSQVSRSLVKLIKAKPRTGWVKADLIASEEANREIISLKKENEELKIKLENERNSPPEGIEQFQSGEDKFTVQYKYMELIDYEYGELQMTWNEIFFIIAPLMINAKPESTLLEELNNYINKVIDRANKSISGLRSIYIDSICFQTIKVQLLVLGLIVKKDIKKSPKDIETYFVLTPYGENLMLKLRGIKK